MERLRKSILFILCISIMFYLVGSVEAKSSKKSSSFQDETIELNSYNRIFLGWIDLHKEHWALHGYRVLEAWSGVINRLNNVFQINCKIQHLTNKEISGALHMNDSGYKDKDLYLEFYDIRIDYNNYNLYLAIDFIDVKTQKILYTIPQTSYYGSAWGFENYLTAALEEVNKKIKLVFRSLR